MYNVQSSPNNTFKSNCDWEHGVRGSWLHKKIVEYLGADSVLKI